MSNDGDTLAASAGATRALPTGRSGGTEQARTRRTLLITCLAVVLARAVYVIQPLRSDEGGYLFAARHWAPGAGEFLYGDYHVDRPPVLLMFYRLAAIWETDAAIRVVTIPVVVVTVLAVAHAGRLLGGAVAARWSAIVAAALLCSPALAGDQADGELFAVMFVAGSVAATLQAWHAGERRVVLGYGFLAGLLAASAPLVKQNFVDGFVFAGALVLAAAVRRRRSGSGHVLLVGSIAAGALAALAAVALWVLAEGVSPAQMWADLVTFRLLAGEAISEASLQAPARRAVLLVLLALASAALPIAWMWLRWALRRRAAPEHWAVGALLAWGVVAIAAGGSFWLHYLLQVVPGVALAAGMVAADVRGGARDMRMLARWAVGASVFGLVGTTLVHAMEPAVSHPEHIGRWLAASAQEDDTVVVGYGSPQILETADLETPYPYLWSLQMRALDPDQERLRLTLAGPQAPTWFVQAIPLNSWNIDEGGRLQSLVQQRYRQVADICGRSVWLRVDVERRMAPEPTC